MDTEIDGDVDDLRALGEIHPEEEDVAPRRMREVHPHRRQFAEDRIRAVRAAPEQLGPDAQRLVGRVSHAEHPLVAAHAADAAPHLVGQRLEGEPVVGVGERGGQPVARALPGLEREEGVDRFLEPPMEQLLVAAERDQGGGPDRRTGGPELLGQTDAFVEVLGLAAEAVELVAGGEQFGDRGGAARGIERLVAHRRIGGGDER